MWNRFSLLPHVVIYIGERLCHTSGNGIEGGALFGELVTAYLFLAGVGAGGVAAASVADLLFVREPFGADVVPDFAEKRPAERLVAGVLALSCGALALGAGCLAADLGRIDRVLSLFTAPPVTLMNLGAWAVALLTALAAALALARFLYVPWLRRCAMVVAEIVACGLAVVVAVYAGLLLQTLSGVRLWSSPWVPALFALSAASCGCALLMAGALFVEGDGSVRKAVRSAARVDVVVIVAEAVAAAGLLAFALGSDHAGVRASATSLMHGPAALPWWAAFVACGLAAALAVEVGCLVRGHGRSRSAAKAVAKAYPAAALARARGCSGPARRGGGGRCPASLGAAGSGSPRFRTFRKRGGGGLAFRAFRRGKRGRRLRNGKRGRDPVVKLGKTIPAGDLFQLDDASSIPVWLQLKNRFIYLITSGFYLPGDQLPTVRGLAAEVEVNYNTVSKVYQSLEEDGYIVSKRRLGAFVADVSDKPGVLAEVTAEIVTAEYLKRCQELGMSLEDIDAQFTAALVAAKAKREKDGTSEGAAHDPQEARRGRLVKFPEPAGEGAADGRAAGNGA